MNHNQIGSGSLHLSVYPCIHSSGVRRFSLQRIDNDDRASGPGKANDSGFYVAEPRKRIDGNNQHLAFDSAQRADNGDRAASLDMLNDGNPRK
ncbi:hypothetical protein U9M48_041917 [Paspalum notatum var. saurae]|uniref:Uncharacterized protein n=1 Tax=Paspalum notatum var. saurae TaxID=547442 RepID=A0AAQ3UPI5_PASNO